VRADFARAAPRLAGLAPVHAGHVPPHPSLPHAPAGQLGWQHASDTQTAPAGFDHSVRIWSAIDGKARYARRSHGRRSDRRVLARRQDARVGEPRYDDPSATARVLRRHKDAARCVTFSPDGKLLATASKDRTGGLWTSTPASRSARRSKVTACCALGEVAFSPDGSTVATASDDGDIRLWNVPDGTQRGDVLRDGHTDWVQCLAFSPNGTQLASASGRPGDERAVRRWDVATGTQLGEPLLGHTAMLTWVAYSSDGKYLASASHDGTVRIWNPATGEHLRTL
jgi:WD40 repeat protein